ncbi:MAG: MotA/TolQ/ExbB proton channel family protein [Rikenellaceae bacterium]|nr:MotA/TolQ/ExbB proton channel family protein [Rikenellaceae bacterium]
MKKLFAILSVAAMMALAPLSLYAQDEAAANEEATVENVEEVEVIEEVAAPDAPAADEFDPEVDVEGEPLHQVLKKQFMDGGVGWMSPLLLCLVLGLAIVIERTIYLNLSTTNTKKLLENVEEALNTGGIEAAKEVCRNTRGPVASIFYQGLDRYNEGLDVVEKSIASYGSVQMGLMERGMSWIGLFIALAPTLGFMGTVVGMIDAFDSIQAAGDISPIVVAAGIKVALLTTVGGLIVAVILQLFYNYLVAKVEGLVLSMEDSSISLVDMLTKYSKK